MVEVLHGVLDIVHLDVRDLPDDVIQVLLLIDQQFQNQLERTLLVRPVILQNQLVNSFHLHDVVMAVGVGVHRQRGLHKILLVVAVRVVVNHTQSILAIELRPVASSDAVLLAELLL